MLRLIQILLRSSLVILISVVFSGASWYFIAGRLPSWTEVLFQIETIWRISLVVLFNIFIFHFNLETFWYVLLGFLVAALLGFLLGFVVYRISLYLQRLGKWIWFGSVKGRVL